MSWQLQGPFPLDLALVTGSARSALTLARAGAGPARKAAADTAPAPGLYLLWREENGVTALGGFWLIFGPSWLDLGPGGQPDCEPPFARDLLGALTEEVWWQTLQVWPVEGTQWRPVVVLEWPHELASRAAVPPPGVPAAQAPDPTASEAGNWVDSDPAPRAAAPVAVVREEPLDLPPRRSLLTLILGKLTYTNARHAASFELAWPPSNTAPLSPVESWLTLEPLAPTGEAHRLGPALALGAGRVGFPLSGWLTRTLGAWPDRADQVRAGALQDRDVGSPWKRQMRQVVGTTLAVIAAVVAVAGAVYFAARPKEQPAPPVIAAAPQPAMSVCSADHQAFVDELRCQIRHLADGGSVYDRACGDPGSPERVLRTSDDLQAQWCGLLDRSLDGWTATGNGDGFAEMAATKACFNVLGQPYAYEADPEVGHPGVALPDPDLFLRDRDLGLRALTGLLGELEGACDLYRRRLEGQVGGAILATAVGRTVPEDTPVAALPEASRLRASVLDQVTQGLPADEARCVRAGASDGVRGPRAWSDLCDGPDALDAQTSAQQGWGVLGGSHGELALIDAYTTARFGEGRKDPSEPLWACHQTLTGRGGRAPGAQRAWWDLTLPALSRYAVDQGAIQSQLILDASLRTLSEGANAGSCWSVVSRRLARYTPVHPLLGAEALAAWPTEEQQICGQICASYYRIRPRSTDALWATPGTDLSLCMDTNAPGARADLGQGHLDRLRLPWNEAQRVSGERGRGRGEAPVRWDEPDPAEICAFHLVAQGYFPPEIGHVLVDDLAPPLWAGSAETGSGLAGGADGAATRAAESLSSYGKARSVATCGYVATQCMVAGALRITERGKLQPYLWVEGWQQWASKLANREDGAADVSPWCGLIQSYLRADGTLPEGQLDYPCAKGVDDTRRGVEAALRALAQGSQSEAR